MPTHNFNRFLLTCATLAFCVSSKSQQKPGCLFKVDPALYDDGFTYLVFPFNDTFIKANEIKTISYNVGKSMNKHIDEFDKNGRLIKTYWAEIKNQSEKADTLHLEERIYNPVTGLLDTLISFDARPLFTSVRCYQYDSQNRLEKVLRFKFTEMKPEKKKNEKAADDFPPPALPALTEPGGKLEPVNELCVHGRPVDPSAFSSMIRNGDFSSVRYSYYMKDPVAVEEQTEFYDFLKKYDDTNICKRKTTYYSYNNKSFLKFDHLDCMDGKVPSEYYKYKNGLLDSIGQEGNYEPGNVQFMYDGKNNLTALSNIWNGEKVSTLEMLYDERGILKEIKRESVGNKRNYFMDAVLRFETDFFR